MTAGKILVTGATGTVGSAVVSELVKAGADVRALVRNPAKAEGMRKAGVDVVEGDLDRPDTLAPALSGVSRVFLLTVPGPQMLAQEQAMIEAILSAEPEPLVVKLSALGASTEASFRFGKLHGDAEQLIVRAGIPFTFLRPTGFMQNLYGSVGSIKEQGALFAPFGDARVSYIDVRDIAAVAAKVLLDDGHESKTYELTGPEALSYADLARILSEQSGITIRYVDVPPGAARAGMLQAGMSEWLADGLLELFAVYRQGGAESVSPAVENVTGRPPRSFELFAAEFVEAIKG